ncbi:hypothetical protein ColTof4_03024 [Colletotrichum tofieldiae]|nr:hypothetical protein ColTof3_13571 [Colletotrichum tofieldiae]GKT70601.1 hypothetical protein ColTof4_03024 [Colletotrichum tofieldiae]GKT94527.1 hypothetical protein Ct61P_12377 [Colletotrichum tofieldiae]
MKLSHTFAAAVLAAEATLATSCQSFRGQDVIHVNGGIGWRYYNENTNHWSWNAQTGHAVIQDDGWVYFDGNGKEFTANIRVSYKDGTTALYQPPNGRNGWCTLPSNGQYNIANIVSWD